MANRKPKETPVDKPVDVTPISLLRIEERHERVPITPEQAQERMRAADATFREADELASEHVEAKENAKQLKQAYEAKRAEGQRIVHDATTGSTLLPYPVIVERHPSRPVEMNVWRVPDGVEAQGIIDAPPPELVDGENKRLDLIAWREAQGCILVETRAMTPEELAIAREEDFRRQNPELPFPGGAPGDTGSSAAEGASGEVVDPAAGAAGNGEEKPKHTSPPPACPFVLSAPVETDPTQDRICGAVGSRRARGLCGDHKEASAAEITRAVARREQRQKIERERAKSVAAANEALAAGEVPPKKPLVADADDDIPFGADEDETPAAANGAAH